MDVYLKRRLQLKEQKKISKENIGIIVMYHQSLSYQLPGVSSAASELPLALAIEGSDGPSSATANTWKKEENSGKERRNKLFILIKYTHLYAYISTQ